MEIDIRDKEIINKTANFVRTYHSKQSKLPVAPGPDEEGLKLLSRVYAIAKKYRQQEKENHYKDEYGASTWGGDPEFYRNIHFVLTWCDKFSVLQEQKDDGEKDVLPFEFCTEETEKYFLRAEEAGYMDGHKWLESQVQLGYFCSKAYHHPRPINALEEFFGVKKLSASISQAECEPKRADGKKWRNAMDKAIFYD